MPCMDDDVLRRGKPTVHVAVRRSAGAAGRRRAAGAGVRGADARRRACRRRCRRGCCALLARAAGRAGMAGGQAIDLASVGLPLDERAAARHAPPQDRRAAARSVLLGAACGAARAPTRLAALDRLRDAVGLAFQVVDDILDVTQAIRPRSARPPARTLRQQQADLRVACWAWTPRARHADELRDEALRGARAQRPAPTPRCAARARRPGRRARQLNDTMTMTRCSKRSTTRPTCASCARTQLHAAGRRAARTSCSNRCRRPAATCRPTSARSS